MSKKIICLTPIKNEEWILDNFLKAASLWADHIIVLDQHSTDLSLEIVKKYNKAILLENDDEYNEVSRQKRLLVEARKIDNKAILIALDADEFLSGNFAEDPDWGRVKNMGEGIVLQFPWDNLYKNSGKYWNASTGKPFGFADDGISEHGGSIIHNDRLPAGKNFKTFLLKNVHVMHFMYTDWARMDSKHRWYQAWERINRPRSSLSIYREYHHMFAIKKNNLVPIPAEWFDYYDKMGVHLKNIKKHENYWWDLEVL